MRRTKKIGIGKLVIHGREHIVALRVSGKGFLMTTLRYAKEVRKGDELFTDIKDGKVDAEQIKLAESIMKSKTAKFDPGAFEDQYREAFFDIVKAKAEGEEPVLVEEEEAPTTFNFIDALKQSVVRAERTGKSAPKKKKKTAKKTAPKKPAAASVSGKQKKRARKPA